MSQSYSFSINEASLDNKSIFSFLSGGHASRGKQASTSLSDLFKLETKKDVKTDFMHTKRPVDLDITSVCGCDVYLNFRNTFDLYKKGILENAGLKDSVTYKASLCDKMSGKQTEYNVNEEAGAYVFSTETLRVVPYVVKVKAELQGKESEWSEKVEFTPEFSKSTWKECPDNVDENRRYSVDEKNPRIATKINGNGYCTIIGNTPLPHNKVTSWNIKILKSRDNSRGSILIGVAPSDIDQNEGWNYNRCGWYFYCCYSTLCSGPPYNYWNKEYGPRKERGKYVHTGDSVGVVMDTAKGELSFVVNGVNIGVAFDGIPLDKPLVPCVLLKNEGDSVELII